MTQETKINPQALQPAVIYIQANDHSQVNHTRVLIQDVAQIYCTDEALAEEVKNIQLMTLDQNNSKKLAVSMMAVISRINEACSTSVIIQNIGATDFLVSAQEKEQKKLSVSIKVLFVTLVTFIGSIFAIMTYNEDVDVSGVFDKLYAIMTGGQRSAPGVLEAAYAVGVALGIIIFFNHFGKRKITRDPTPMEIEMEKYEADIGDTLIKEASRKNDILDK